MSRYIDADDFVMNLEKRVDGKWYEALLSADDVECLIDQQKSVDGVKHGHWIEHNTNVWDIYGECSICGFEQGISDSLKYCPNCGAKMDGNNIDEVKNNDERSE